MGKKVSFRTHVELKSILGKDLITDDNIAVQELIKNSFDAGSTISKVEFIGIKHGQPSKEYKKKNKSQIVISDTGKGMNMYDLINKWLNIAYSEKKEKKEEYNRHLAGNKGVGRFSCDRLGKLLTIYTKQVDKAMLKLHIDWRTLEHISDINLNIQDIEFDLDEISIVEFEKEIEQKGIHLDEPFKRGTVLCIESLREEWDRPKILSLKRQLEKLISPNQTFNSEKFEIEIIAKEYVNEDKKLEDFQQINGTVENKIFEKLNFRVTSIQSKISRDGRYIITLLKDRGKTIFTLIEKNRYDLLKDVKTHIYYLNPYSKTYFMKQTGIRTRDFGSISLFINGFRIPPYGDAGDDWLGMESRAAQGTSRYLSARAVVGRIEVNGNEETSDDEDDEFKIISSRSGVRDNKIFRQLAKSTSPFGFFYKAFRRLERFVVEGISWDSAPTVKIEKQVEKDPNWDVSKEEFKINELTRSRQIVSVVEKIINAKEDEIVRLRINKSLVSDLIDSQISKLNSDINLIADQINSKEFNGEQLDQLLKRLNESKKELSSFVEEIDSKSEEDIKSESRIRSLTKSQESLEDQLSSLKRKLVEAENARVAAEEAAAKAQQELEIEKDRLTYLVSKKRDLSSDAEGLVHNIKFTSGKIKTNLDLLVDKIQDDTIKKKELLQRLGTIRFNADKALKISNLITRANFKTQKEKQVIDIPKFFEQYVGLYSELFDYNQVKFDFKSSEDIKFESKKSVLDLSVIFDDLLSNSEKAGAKKIEVSLNLNINKELELIFADNGKGLDEKFQGNPEKIFESGVTTTDGSGIGLYFVKDLLKKMNATIKYEGIGVDNKGAAFKIVFK
ncbi:MAG: ATP-binding protein [Cytophagales bacterium]